MRKFMQALFRTSLLPLFFLFISACESKLPEYHSTQKVHWLEQNWTPEIWDRFYHTPQGTQIIPYHWFIALEQPKLTIDPFQVIPKFSEPTYLGRFGFLPADKSPLNPDGLPVGFARDDNFIDPYTNEHKTVVAFTCAACHTGQLDTLDTENRRIGIRIDGGSSLVNPLLFEAELGKALLLTEKIPTRFNRFAKRVLSSNHSAEAKATLKSQLKQLVRSSIRLEKIRDRKHIYPLELGYGRVDALNDIGNQVFALQLSDKNWGVSAGPVNLPHIWETSWFDYVQYNGSIPNPLVRNIGESLGVNAPIVLTGDKSNWFRTSINIPNLVAMEGWLAGDAPYKGLQAPIWPEKYLGAIDQVKADNGQKLYAELCITCHYGSRDVLQRDESAETPIYWTARNSLGQPLLKVVMTDLDVIGTDPKQATDFIERKIDTENLGLGVINGGLALTYVVEQVAKRFFVDNNISEEDQLKFANGHKIGAEESRTPHAYMARPLAGIWATPPFLHNGSVPTLYHLLLPASERPTQFTVGNRLFDSKLVGYEYGPLQHISPFNTLLPGNSNLGHEFNDGIGKGIIGRKLTETERWEMVEYLKTL
jgi:hypothetical protein